MGFGVVFVLAGDFRSKRMQNKRLIIFKLCG
jgi:hypothetical protein